MAINDPSEVEAMIGFALRFTVSAAGLGDEITGLLDTP
jgi:hypothetical protein